VGGNLGGTLSLGQQDFQVWCWLGPTEGKTGREEAIIVLIFGECGAVHELFHACGVEMAGLCKKIDEYCCSLG